MALKDSDVISIRDLEKKDVELVLRKAKEMEAAVRVGRILNKMRGRSLATLFFEPSTRTILSFNAAMQKLGGDVLNFGRIEQSSVAKGESLVDTVKIVEGYSDLIVIRHPKEGSARLAADVSEKPVINGGDGSNQHPTQTLLDLYSIKKFKGKIGGLNISLFGDLKHARVMKSLAYALAMFNANLTLVSPFGLEMDKTMVEEIKERFGSSVIQTNDMQAGMRNADVLYVCRIQKERFADAYEAERLQRVFRITPKIIEQGKEDLVILHALPKVAEIDPEVNKMKQAKYFEQAALGVPVRMAIIDLVIG